MNRKEVKLIQKAMVKENKTFPAEMIQLPQEKWPKDQPENLIEVWRSRKYLAQVYQEAKTVRVSVCRTMLDFNGRWEDGLSWDELMEIKRQIGRGDAYAVEVLPPDKDIVNVANMRHFWIMPRSIVGWVKP